MFNVKKLLFLAFFLPSAAYSSGIFNPGSGGGGGGGSGSPLEVFSNFDGVKSSPTLSISVGDPLKLTVSGSTAVVTVDFSTVASRGDVILLQNTLQSGSTFYVSSGTVRGPFHVNAVPDAGANGMATGLSVSLQTNKFSPDSKIVLRTDTGVCANCDALTLRASDKADDGTEHVEIMLNPSAATGDGVGGEEANFRVRDVSGSHIYSSRANSKITSVLAHSFTSTATFNYAVVDGAGLAGTSGQVLTSNGDATYPTWQTSSGGVTGSTVPITLVYLGGGSAIAAGVEASTACTTIPFALTLSSWSVIAMPPSVSGSISVTIRKSAVATPSTFSAMSAGGNQPSMTSSLRDDGTPTSWTSTALAAGEMVCGEVTSATSVTKAVVTLWGYR